MHVSLAYISQLCRIYLLSLTHTHLALTLAHLFLTYITVLPHMLILLTQIYLSHTNISLLFTLAPLSHPHLHLSLTLLSSLSRSPSSFSLSHNHSKIVGTLHNYNKTSLIFKLHTLHDKTQYIVCLFNYLLDLPAIFLCFIH